MQVCPSIFKERKWCGKCWVIRLLGAGSSSDPETRYDKAAEGTSHTLTKVEQAFAVLLVDSSFVLLCYSPIGMVKCVTGEALLG